MHAVDAPGAQRILLVHCTHGTPEALTGRAPMREEGDNRLGVHEQVAGSASVSTAPCSWNRTSASVACATAPAILPENSNSPPVGSSGSQGGCRPRCTESWDLFSQPMALRENLVIISHTRKVDITTLRIRANKARLSVAYDG